MPPLLAAQEPDPSFRFLIFPDRVLLLLSPGTGKRFYQESPGLPGTCETVAYKEQNMFGALIWILTRKR